MTGPVPTAGDKTVRRQPGSTRRRPVPATGPGWNETSQSYRSPIGKATRDFFGVNAFGHTGRRIDHGTHRADQLARGRSPAMRNPRRKPPRRPGSPFGRNERTEPMRSTTPIHILTRAVLLAAAAAATALSVQAAPVPSPVGAAPAMVPVAAVAPSARTAAHDLPDAAVRNDYPWRTYAARYLNGDTVSARQCSGFALWGWTTGCGNRSTPRWPGWRAATA